MEELFDGLKLSEFKEEDLNDPELLAELAGLTDEPVNKPVAKGSAKPVLKESSPDVDSIIAAIPYATEDDDIENVVLTEEDMNDPELLAELKAVGGNAHEDIAESTVESDVDIPQVQVPQDIIPKQNIVPEATLESKLNSTNVESLMQFIQVEKVRALNKKRSGDRQGALDSLKMIKDFQARIDELQMKSASNHMPTSADAMSSVPIEQASHHEIVPQMPPQAQPPSEPKLDLIWNERCLEYKNMALRYKKENNLEKARENLAISKSIQGMIDQIKSGALPSSFTLPNPPLYVQNSPLRAELAIGIGKETKSSPSTLKPQIPIITPQSVNHSESSKHGLDLINHLIETLAKQIELSTKLSAQYFTSNQKDLALEYHKKKKRMIQDKDTLSSMNSAILDPSSLPFHFQYSDLNYSMAIVNNEVAIDELELSIIRGNDILIAGESDPELSVAFDIGWPSNSDGTLAPGKGVTKPIKGINPEFNHTSTVKIEKTKAFQRYLERKKATFEVNMATKSFFGLMSQQKLIGKASLKIDQLLTRCEVHQYVQLTDPSNPRKNISGKVEVRLRLRTPLLRPEIVSTTQRWLEVTFGTQEPQKRAEITETKSTIPDSQKNVNVEPKKALPQSKENPKVAQDEASIDDLEHQFLMPENIASNAVLEHEHQLLIQEITKVKPPPEDVLDLKSSYEIKMNMLVMSIQLGNLDMPTYINQVKAALAHTKTIALQFKKGGRLDLAKKAMVRIKLMEGEISEVENN